MAHLRDNPFPRPALAPGAGVGPGAQAVRMLAAPQNAQILSDAALWLALEFEGPMPPSFAAELDSPRLGMLSMLETLARIVVHFRTALSSVILRQEMASYAGQEALFPLAQLGGKWRPSFLRLVCAAALPPAVAGDDRGPRLAVRAEHLLCQTMSSVANAPSSLGSFRLSNVLAYTGRSPQQALVSLVGADAARVPGRYGPPPPPATLPALHELSVGRIAEELGEDLPYETLLELDGDVKLLRDACAAAVQTAQETREATVTFRADAMTRLAAVEARMPGARTFVALEDLEEFRHSHQMHLEALRAEVRTLQGRVLALRLEPGPAAGPT